MSTMKAAPVGAVRAQIFALTMLQAKGTIMRLVLYVPVVAAVPIARAKVKTYSLDPAPPVPPAEPVPPVPPVPPAGPVPPVPPTPPVPPVPPTAPVPPVPPGSPLVPFVPLVPFSPAGPVPPVPPTPPVPPVPPGDPAAPVPPVAPAPIDRLPLPSDNTNPAAAVAGQVYVTSAARFGAFWITKKLLPFADFSPAESVCNPKSRVARVA